MTENLSRNGFISKKIRKMKNYENALKMLKIAIKIMCARPWFALFSDCFDTENIVSLT